MSGSRLHAPGGDKNSKAQLKRFQDHSFEPNQGDEYSASTFGGFSEYFARKKIKLQNNDAVIRESAAAENSPPIFSGVVATVNGYTNPGLAELHILIVKYGGVFLQYLEGKTAVTHIIASALTPKKRVEFKRYRVVKPQWVTESVKAGVLLPWHQFRVVEEGPRQKVLFGGIEGGSSSQEVGGGGESPGKVLGLSHRVTRARSSYKEQSGLGQQKWRVAPIKKEKKSEEEVKEQESQGQEVQTGGRKQSFAVVIPVKRKEELGVAKLHEERPRITLGEEIIDEPDHPPDGPGKILPSYQLPPPPSPAAELSSHQLIRDEIPESSPPWNHEPDDPGLASHQSQIKDEVPESSPLLDLEPEEKVSGLRKGYMANSITQSFLEALENMENLDDHSPFADTFHKIKSERSTQTDSAILPAPAVETVGPQALDNGPATAPTTPGKQVTIKQEFFEPPPKVSPSASPLPAQSPSDEVAEKRFLVPEAQSLSKKSKLTAEEHNAALLANPRIRNATVLNPDFLQQYYQESRLHHLSTWKADLKAQLQELTSKSLKKPPGRNSLQRRPKRYILHVDFDCFFAAVSIRSHTDPESIINKPICVSHSTGGNSEVASCNYRAREFGVKNGMWMRQATTLCPDILSLPYNFPAYEDASRAFYEVLLSLDADIVQSVSVDEALVDVTTQITENSQGNLEEEHERVTSLATKVRDSIRDKTKCEVSVGIGGNILLAKLALRKAKPAGQYHLRPEEVLDFLAPLKYQDLPGIGYSIGGKLEEELQIKTIGEARVISREKLKAVLGAKTGERLFNYVRGIDHTEVGDVMVRKSVSADVNWGVRFETKEQTEEFLHNLAGELSRRLLAQNFKGKQLTLKVQKRAVNAPLDPPKFLGHGLCDTFNKSVILGVATFTQDVIGKEACGILRSFNFPPGELRGLGLQMTKLEKVKGDDPAGSQKKLEFKSRTVVNDELGKGKERLIKLEEESKDLPSPFKIPEKRPARPPSPLTPSINVKGEPTASSPFRIQSPGFPASTQFFIPSQIDQSVLDALPSPIRTSILSEQQKQQAAQSIHSNTIENSQPQKPNEEINFSIHTHDFPSQSQLDLEVLNSLPAELRAEVLAAYNTSRPDPSHHQISPNKNNSTLAGPSSRAGSGKPSKQSILPQSPRKNRIITAPPTKPSPTKRRPGGLFGNHANKEKDNRTLTSGVSIASSTFPGFRDISPNLDANPIANPSQPAPHILPWKGKDPLREDTLPPSTPLSALNIDKSFLAELPPEIQEEVIEAAHREQLRREAALHRQSQQPSKASKLSLQLQPQFQLGQEQQQQQPLVVKTIPIIPARLRKPVFMRLSGVTEVRELIRKWYVTCKEEGPHEEDVWDLKRYLQDVVEVERDMGKARGLVRWFVLCCEEGGEGGSGSSSGSESGGEGGEERGKGKKGQRSSLNSRSLWRKAVEDVIVGVQDAVKRRGLGPMDI